MYRLGIDIGGTKIKIGVISTEKTILCSEKIFVNQIKNKSFFEAVGKAAVEFLNKNDLKSEDFDFCGVGVPGTVDKTGKIAYKLPNLNIYNENGADVIEKIIKIPTRLIQDSRAAAWGEFLAGAGKGYESVVCITIGTGIGTGIVLDGKIFDGAKGTAGEMGHNTVVANGRKCSCGKNGCLGFYSAGLGLEMTAKELFGECANSEMLFDEAKKGNVHAKEKLTEAIMYLGNEIVSLYNNIAPDCLLFSGGISEQKDFYIEPLIKYIKEHIYTIEGGSEPYMGIAKLGEDAPMTGAALLPFTKRKRPKLSASIMCGDIMNMQSDFERLEEAGIDLFHMDIMDGHFVPNMMMPTEYINIMKKHTKIPFDIHIMAENPDSIIDNLTIGEGDIVSVHYESTPHIQRTLSLIKSKGAKAALALNPSTPIECAVDLLDDVDMILIMTVNPGFSGQKLIPACLKKTERMREYLDKNGFENIEIEVDGNCSFENIPNMYSSGANIFVLGTSSIFRSDMSIKEGTEKVFALLDEVN